ncbi:MAG: VPLPA-CTERM sorting domain-containing protein [bacterium]|jgi:hypothetical protein|nr:VPLPA-CTERM sorting domain-containing protein [Betaproteobacteria bacterium]
MKRFLLSALLAATVVLPVAAPVATAATINVFAFQNSSTGGVGAVAGVLNVGEAFSVSVDPLDLWSAGALPRWSNADGLTGNLLATGSDESGQAINTLIGQSFGLHSQGNLSAAFGTLVGRIGGGNFFAVGTSYAGIAANSGQLELFYWDSNFGDNREFITATVNTSVVPLPAAAWLFIAGMLGMVGVTRRRRNAA